MKYAIVFAFLITSTPVYMSALSLYPSTSKIHFQSQRSATAQTKISDSLYIREMIQYAARHNRIQLQILLDPYAHKTIPSNAVLDTDYHLPTTGEMFYHFYHHTKHLTYSRYRERDNGIHNASVHLVTDLDGLLYILDSPLIKSVNYSRPIRISPPSY